MHVPVHAAQEGGEADGWTDQCGPGAHEVPERLPTGRRGQISIDDGMGLLVPQ